MTTVATVLNRASRQMLAGVVEERNKLATSLTSGDTSVVTSYDLGGLRTGSVFEIGSELFYVWNANPASKTLTVERGYAGTTAASHASGEACYLRFRFFLVPYSIIRSFLDSDISWRFLAALDLYLLIVGTSRKILAVPFTQSQSLTGRSTLLIFHRPRHPRHAGTKRSAASSSFR